jgi:hypothetical protein
MSIQDEQKGLELVLVAMFGEHNRIKIRKVISENTPKLKGKATREWKKNFAVAVLMAIHRDIKFANMKEKSAVSEAASLSASARPKSAGQESRSSTLQMAADLEETGRHFSSVQPIRRASKRVHFKGVEKGAEDRSCIRGDVGPQILRSVAQIMQIEADWCVAEERSITWWGHTLSQRIWADPVFIEMGDDIVRVHAESDFLRNVRESPSIPELLSELNGDASLSSYVWNPAHRTIKMRCSAFVHSQNLEWLERLFAWAAAIQAAEAHSLAESLAMRLGADIDTSVHPTNGRRETPDEMLSLIQYLANLHSKETRAFTNEDFKTASDISPAPWVMANADEDGFTAEFPFPGCVPPTSLFMAKNKSIHPRLGAGLLLVLRLPIFFPTDEAEALALKLNSAELTDRTRTHFMGGWCVDRQRNRALFQGSVMLEERTIPSVVVDQKASSILSFCAFVPSVAHQPSVFPNLVFAMAHRARWANEFLASENGVPKLLGPRDRDSHNAQRLEHLDLLGGVLRRVKRQPKRKPN